MPRQDLTREQRTALVAFLKAQQGSNISRAPLRSSFRPRRPTARSGSRSASIVGPEHGQPASRGSPRRRRGEALLPKVGCLSCHKLDERDGRVGPDLAFTAAQRDVPWLMAHFKDPKSVVPGSLMPPYPLPDEIFDVAVGRTSCAGTVPAIPARAGEALRAALLPLPRREGPGRRRHRRATSTRSRAT